MTVPPARSIALRACPTVMPSTMSATLNAVPPASCSATLAPPWPFLYRLSDTRDRLCR